MRLEQNKTKQLVLTGMMTAVVCVLSILEIPMPTGVPITLQTFALALCGYLLGLEKGRTGSASLSPSGSGGGALGSFSGMTGGIQVMLGLTGGFIGDFRALGCAVRSWIREEAGSFGGGIRGFRTGCGPPSGGTSKFSLLSGQYVSTCPLMLVSVPYLVKDLLSVAGAYLVSLALKKVLKAADLYCPG